MRIYHFGGGGADGTGAMKDLLGGKGAGLAEMARLGLPVPPGFTITTEACSAFFAAGEKLPAGLSAELRAAVGRIERHTGRKLGDPTRPLLLSVRSGARASMPGMMDTILDLGLDAETCASLGRQAGARFAWDSYRRFAALFGSVVLGISADGDDGEDPFEALLEERKERRGATSDTELDAADLEAVARASLALIEAKSGKPLPKDPFEQLELAVEAVFRSWNNPRADAYRRLHGIPAAWGTACTVQSMVFGNLGDDSGTGVAFTRNPATGEDALYGEFLVNAQGEDVVAGVRTPWPIAKLAAVFPDAYAELVEVRKRLEAAFRDMQDIEFTVEKKKLWVLQCRNGKRTGLAAVRIAVEQVAQGLLSEKEALLRVEPQALDQLLRPVFDPAAKAKALADGRVIAHGLPAGPGSASGHLSLSPADAEARAKRGERVILARPQTSPEDIRGMAAAEGLLTAFGGMTSHAALVARQMGKVAVVGCGALKFDFASRTLSANGVTMAEGDQISLDGSAGEVIVGEVQSAPAEVMRVIDGSLAASDAPAYRAFDKLLGWADRTRRLGVRANADQPDQAARAVALGAEGIGLCRTEHMFFGPGKIGPMREMILSRTLEERKAALAKLLPLQRADFAGLFRALAGRPCTVRTLDPPLHEFLPHDEAGVFEVARATGLTTGEVKARIAALAETNPMLGQRGCRLGIEFPEITETQVRALFEAACDVAADGVKVRPLIMIPLVGARLELAHQKAAVVRAAEAVFAERHLRVPFMVGTMIEVPRAAIVAGEIAREAEFFSFGTNDLTQLTFGLSRDDVAPVLERYLAAGIYEVDPFVTLDSEGVLELVRIALHRGRHTRRDLEAGICGEHGGDPRSIQLCHDVGLDYVSCSPLRVPIARLAAAQAALRT